jgi:hypothetical protein
MSGGIRMTSMFGRTETVSIQASGKNTIAIATSSRR